MGFGAGPRLRPVPAPRSAAEEAAGLGQRRRGARQGEAEPARLAPGGAMGAGACGGRPLAGAASYGLLALLLVVSAPLGLQAAEPGEWSAGGRRGGPGLEGRGAGGSRGRRLHPAESCSVWPAAAGAQNPLLPSDRSPTKLLPSPANERINLALPHFLSSQPPQPHSLSFQTS